MQKFERIRVLFVAGFGPIVRDRAAGGNSVTNVTIGRSRQPTRK
jgi:hypothetical protein